MLTAEDKKWIASEIAGQISASEERMGARIASTEERMGAGMEKMETALLTEFHKWASPVVTRLRSHSDALRTLDLEIESLQNRVDKLEKE